MLKKIAVIYYCLLSSVILLAPPKRMGLPTSALASHPIYFTNEQQETFGNILERINLAQKTEAVVLRLLEGDPINQDYQDKLNLVKSKQEELVHEMKAFKETLPCDVRRIFDCMYQQVAQVSSTRSSAQKADDMQKMVDEMRAQGKGKK